MLFSDRSKSTALRNCHCSRCDPKKDLFYQFSTPSRFHTTKTHGGLREQWSLTRCFAIMRRFRAANHGPRRLAAEPWPRTVRGGISRNAINEAILPKLTAEDLKDIGVTAVGHRLVLLDAIAALRGETPPKRENA
jgi:hypothetical protein